MEEQQKENGKSLWVKLYRLERSLEFLREGDEQAAWNRLMRKHQKHRFYSLSIRIGSYAACIAMVVCLAYWFFSYRDPATQETDVRTALQASYPEKGGDKAILTLGNGEVIDLASSQGQVSRIAQNSRGKRLVYHPQDTNDDKVQYNTLTIPRGGEYHVVLADGTRVWLNAESSLHYPENFVGDTREVTLTGEAYFEVKHDERHPFKVHTSLGTISVLGTSFNVSAYPRTPVCATLVSGKVKVSNSTSDVVLSPNHQALMGNTGEQIRTQWVDASLVSSWRTGVYQFQDTPLRDIMAQLSRWYDVDIQFQTPALEEIRFTGAILRDEELGFAINVISEISNVDFARKGKVVWVSRKGS